MKTETRIVLKYKPGSKYPLEVMCQGEAYVGRHHAVSDPLQASQYGTVELANTFKGIISEQGDSVEVAVLKITIEETINPIAPGTIF